MADPADQRTADRETIARALCRQWAGAERSLDEVVAPGRALWQRFLPEADAVLAVLVPADLVRAEALEAWASTVRAKAEADERGLTDIPFGELPQNSRIMLNGVTRAAERAVARAAEYRKAAGA